MDKFINGFDEIVRWQKEPSDKKMVIKYLATKFDYNKEYTEKDVNKIIYKINLFTDIPLLRKELVSQRMLCRKDDCT